MRWRRLLEKAVLARGSQAAVAREIGYSPSAVSMALAGTYPGDTAAIEQKLYEIYGGKKMQEIPEGYMENGVGNLVRIEKIKEIDLARDQFVKDVMVKVKAMNGAIESFKKELSGDMQAFLELSAEKYQADLGGARGNLSLATYDGKYKVLRAVADRLDFDERLQAAKALVDDCLREWTKDSGAEIRTLVESAFQVDKKGRINAKRILSLRSLQIEHPTWKRAMEAISDAVTVVGSCTYYRFYERDEEGNYHQIIMDFSGV